MIETPPDAADAGREDAVGHDAEPAAGPPVERQHAVDTRAPAVETPAYAAMMRRMIRAYGRRVADADVEDLAELIELRQAVDEAIATAVRSSRERHGRSWADVARAAGVTRQAAQQRWG